MTVNNSSSAVGGIGFGNLLTIVFIVLKLLGKISWSWWWVLAPTWVPVALLLLVLLLGFVTIAVKELSRD